MRLLAALLVFQCACATSQVAPPETNKAADEPRQYSIRLSRPPRVGDRGRFIVDGHHQQTTLFSAGDRHMRRPPVDAVVHFDAVITVLAPDGQQQGLTFESVIIRFELKDAAGAHAVAHEGQILRTTGAKREEDAIVTLDGQQVDEWTRGAVALVLSLRLHDEHVNADVVFGSRQLRRVGETWQADGEAAARGMLAGMGISGTMSGHSTLTRLVSVEGVECMELANDLSGTIGKAEFLPQGSSVREGAFILHTKRQLPLDARLPLLSFSLSRDTALVADVPAGAEVPAGTMTFRWIDQQTSTYQPLH